MNKSKLNEILGAKGYVLCSGRDYHGPSRNWFNVYRAVPTEAFYSDAGWNEEDSIHLATVKVKQKPDWAAMAVLV